MSKGEKLEQALRPVFERWERERDLKARDEIIQAFLWLPAYLARRYVGKGHEYDDLYQNGCIGLINAVTNYDSRVGPFCAYAYEMILGEIKHLFRQDKMIRGAESVLLVPEPWEFTKAEEDAGLAEIGVREIVQSVLRSLPERERKIVLLVLDGNNQRAVAEKVGTNQMEISRIYKKFRAAVRRELYEL